MGARERDLKRRGSPWMARAASDSLGGLDLAASFVTPHPDRFVRVPPRPARGSRNPVAGMVLPNDLQLGRYDVVDVDMPPNILSTGVMLQLHRGHASAQ